MRSHFLHALLEFFYTYGWFGLCVFPFEPRRSGSCGSNGELVSISLQEEDQGNKKIILRFYDN